MNKRQLKKLQKKLILLVVENVFETCMAENDPLAKFQEIRSQGEKYFNELGVVLSPEVFDEIMIQLEPIVKKEVEAN